MAHQDEDIRTAARAPYGPLAAAPHPQQIGDKALFIDPEAGQALYQVQSGNYVKVAGPGALPAATTSALGAVVVGDGLAVDASGVLSAAFVKLAEVVLSGAQASIAFTSIAATYRTLQLIVQGRGDAALTARPVRLQCNGDGAANYDWSEIYVVGNSVGGDGTAADTSIQVGGVTAASAPAGAASLIDILLANYAGTTFYKSVRSLYQEARDGTGAGQVSDLTTGQWRSSAAISTLALFPASGNFAAGTTASLYAWL